MSRQNYRKYNAFGEVYVLLMKKHLNTDKHL